MKKLLFILLLFVPIICGSLGEYLGAGNATTCGLWHLNGNANDVSGNSNNGTIAGAVTSSLGKLGSGCYSFANSTASTPATNYIYVLNNANYSPGAGNFTISFWMKTADTRNAYNMWIIQKTNGNNTFGVYYTKFFKLAIFFSDGSANTVTCADAIAINDNKWHNIIAVRNGTTGYLYKDGEYLCSNTNESLGTINTNTTGSYLWFGTNSASTTPGEARKSYAGLLDEIIIENVAWTNVNIKKYYTFTKQKFTIKK